MYGYIQCIYIYNSDIKCMDIDFVYNAYNIIYQYMYIIHVYYTHE